MTAVIAFPRVSAPARRAVGWWLIVVALLVAAMVTLGGLTRLTGSGLSITEWHPVTGAIPPLSEQAWQAEFAKYQHIPQYRLENRGMDLAGFKAIYWWEWSHRLLGRLVGAVFLLPFLFFALTGAIPRKAWPRMVLLFALGGLQGFVGWWMVQSGLETRVAVSQYRLAIHLGVAVILFGALLWTALEYLRQTSAQASCVLRQAQDEENLTGIGVDGKKTPLMLSLSKHGGFFPNATSQSVDAKYVSPASRGEKFAWGLVALIYLQMLLGALVAGLHAGLVYNTWPSMNGRFAPEDAFVLHPWWKNFFENPGLAQFDHRMIAYLVAAGVAAFWILARRLHGGVRASSNALFAIVLVQIALGIATLLNQAPLALAALHQATAVAVFAAALWNAYEVSTVSRVSRHIPI